MTDPLALDPVLSPRERSQLRFNDAALPSDARYAHFEEHVTGGGKVEATDWMPDEYRARLRKFIEMHGNSELMGVLPEREWILRAPTLQRKLALTAKVQDEVGHAQLIYRVVEDLGKTREECLDDLISGKSKFHNVFHYPTKTWKTPVYPLQRGFIPRTSRNSSAPVPVFASPSGRSAAP
jgi:hypothetical protein